MKIQQFVEHSKIVGDYIVFTRVLSFSPEENDTSEILRKTEMFFKEHYEQPLRVKDERGKIICRKYADVILANIFDSEIDISFSEFKEKYFKFINN